MNDRVRKQKSADQLVVGDWLAPYELHDGAAEVLHVLKYRPERGDEDFHVHLVVREQGKTVPHADVVAGGWLIDLASDEDLAELREAAGRAQKIADIRAYADWLESHPDVAMPYGLGGQQDVVGDNATAADVATVRAFAERFGARLSELTDRTVAYHKIGSVEYNLIAWHREGRPAEPKPLVDPDASMEAHYDAEADDRTPHPSWPTEQELKPWESLAPTADRIAESMEPAAEDLGDSFDRSQTADADETPVVGRRREAHTGGMTEAGLVDETETAPLAQHEISTAWKSDEPGQCGAECRCGVTYDGFDSLAEAQEHLVRHIEAATSPTGMTKAADESRGVLAFTTPVVTYFSFGHGQTDPATGKSLLDHYVTVVAPTYEACREAMFASRFGREWSFDYLAGTAKATLWIPRWTEHEVIVAPGTDQSLAEAALIAAYSVLAAGPVSESR